MMRYVLPAVLLAACSLLVRGEVGEAKKKPASLLRRTAPEIVADAALNGKARRLSDYRGKVVLLDFWAVWCGPCIASFPHLRDLHHDYHDEGLEIIGVTAYQERFDFDPESKRLKIVGSVKEGEGDKKFTVIGGLTREQEKKMLKSFLSHHELRYPLFAIAPEEWRPTADKYGVKILPTTVLIDRLGVVRLVQEGFSEDQFTELTTQIEKLLAER